MNPAIPGSEEQQRGGAGGRQDSLQNWPRTLAHPHPSHRGFSSDWLLPAHQLSRVCSQTDSQLHKLQSVFSCSSDYLCRHWIKIRIYIFTNKYGVFLTAWYISVSFLLWWHLFHRPAVTNPHWSTVFAKNSPNRIHSFLLLIKNSEQACKKKWE